MESCHGSHCPPLTFKIVFLLRVVEHSLEIIVWKRKSGASLEINFLAQVFIHNELTHFKIKPSMGWGSPLVRKKKEPKQIPKEDARLITPGLNDLFLSSFCQNTVHKLLEESLSHCTDNGCFPGYRTM